MTPHPWDARQNNSWTILSTALDPCHAWKQLLYHEITCNQVGSRPPWDHLRHFQENDYHWKQEFARSLGTVQPYRRNTVSTFLTLPWKIPERDKRKANQKLSKIISLGLFSSQNGCPILLMPGEGFTILLSCLVSSEKYFREVLTHVNWWFLIVIWWFIWVEVNCYVFHKTPGKLAEELSFREIVVLLIHLWEVTIQGFFTKTTAIKFICGRCRSTLHLGSFTWRCKRSWGEYSQEVHCVISHLRKME